MKLDKIYLRLERAKKTVSKRMGIPMLSPTSHAILTLLKGRPYRFTGLLHEVAFHTGGMSPMAIYDALTMLTSSGLVSKENGLYSITIQGREYLSLVRRYLVNIRIS